MSQILLSLIAQGEGQQLEFKEEFGKEVVETPCAFSNTQGGRVIIGIDDHGNVQGIPFNNVPLQQYINQIKTQTQPQPGLVVDIEKHVLKGQTILVVCVGEFPIKSVSFKGRFYLRKANSNHLLNLTEIENIHLQSFQLSWDSYPVENTPWEALGEAKVNTFIKRVNQKG